jgi:hypothetical protein
MAATGLVMALTAVIPVMVKFSPRNTVAFGVVAKFATIVAIIARLRPTVAVDVVRALA